MRWLNPWVILAAVVALGGALTGTFFYGSSVGEAKAEAKWQKRELAINAESEKKIAAANARVLDAERKSADSMASVSKAYQEKLLENENAKDRAIARIRAGSVRLRDPAAIGESCRNTLPSTGPAPSGRDGETRAELPVETVGVLSGGASEFLIGEASRADKIVEQLTSCQAIVEAYRRAD